MTLTLAKFFQILRALIKHTSHLEIYTDGSSKDGYGSWAYVVTRNGQTINENSGRVRCANSNTMEFQAAIEALKDLPKHSTVSLFTDSKILVDTLASRKGHPSFQSQLNTLLSLNQNHNIKWKWVKAHNGNKFNERCDELCTAIRGT